MVKYSLARSLSPSPMVFDTTALPPVPAIKPIDATAIRTGKVRLMAAKGVVPTKFETKNPSTML